jgi:hypothetical protein
VRRSSRRSGPPSRPASRRSRRRAAAAARAAELAKPAAASPAPPITFRFIGKMGSPKTPLAVLADGNDIYTVKEGEVVNEKFKILKIDFESVTIGYVNPIWTETRTIRMGT